LVDAVFAAMGLDQLPGEDHQRCEHQRNPHWPDLFLVGLLLRTRMGARVESGRQMATDSIHGIGETLAAAYPANGPLVTAEPRTLTVWEPLADFEVDRSLPP
jgi:hypothetical protein